MTGIPRNQYDIIIVNLDPTIGGEVKKKRPCVIISPDEINHNLRTSIIAPLTSTSKSYPTRVAINLNGRISWVMLEQIRTIDKKRVTKVVGHLSDSEILEVKRVIQETFVD